MLGCGTCARCTSGRQHLCADRYEIGVRHGWPGALAEQLPVPARALVPLPASVGPSAGAMVEPGGNALRAVRAAGLAAGERLLVLGPGTIGLLVARIAAAMGIEVHLVGRSERSRTFARALGFGSTLDAGHDARPALGRRGRRLQLGRLPALAMDLVEPGRRVVYIGLAGQPSLVDTRTMALKDVTAVGVLSASGGLEGIAGLYASGAVDPLPLVAATVSLDEVAGVLAGGRQPGWGDAPKIHVDPRADASHGPGS